MGVPYNRYVGLMSAIGGYYMSIKLLKTKKVPYQMLSGLLSYIIGSNVGAAIYGDMNHRVYYTKKEQQIIAQTFGERWTSDLKVVPEDNP